MYIVLIPRSCIDERLCTSSAKRTVPEAWPGIIEIPRERSQTEIRKSTGEQSSLGKTRVPIGVDEIEVMLDFPRWYREEVRILPGCGISKGYFFLK